MFTSEMDHWFGAAAVSFTGKIGARKYSGTLKGAHWILDAIGTPWTTRLLATWIRPSAIEVEHS